MNIAVDIGGTKTLVAIFDNRGKVAHKTKFPTPKIFTEFIRQLINTTQLLDTDYGAIKIISIGTAGQIDRQHGIIINSPNLNWHNKPLIPEIKKIYKSVPIIIENDANLAGLSEAHNLDNINQKVMYITFSTGVGTGFIVNGILDPDLLDSEGGHMVFEHEGNMVDWESFTSGRAIVKKYGKMASELDDPEAWQEISKNMAEGIIDNCAVFPADTVIIGGGVGTHFHKFGNFLNTEVAKLAKISIMIKKPMIVGAKNPEEAVMLGCIIIAQQYEHRK